jgi:hypothetical protein
MSLSIVFGANVWRHAKRRDLLMGSVTCSELDPLCYSVFARKSVEGTCVVTSNKIV